MIPIVSLDSVVEKVDVHNDAGAHVFSLVAATFVVKHYQDAGVLYCELRGEEALLAFYDLAHRPLPLRLVWAEEGRWRVLPAGPQPPHHDPGSPSPGSPP